MDLQSLANVLVAATVTHTIHTMVEPITVKLKLKRLVAYMDKVKDPPTVPPGMETLPKAMFRIYLVMAIIFTVAYVVTGMIDPEIKTAAIFALAGMVIIELVNTLAFHKYHAAIEVVTKRFKK